MGGAWSDSEDGDEQPNDATCLMAIDSQEVVSKPSKSNINSNIIDLQRENEELLKFNKDFTKTFEKLLKEKCALEDINLKLSSKINDLEIEVKKLVNKETRFKDLLQKVSHHGLDLWLQVQIFYDHVDYTAQMAIDYAAGGRLKKLRLKIEDLAQHEEEEEWNGPIFYKKGSPDYIEATLEQEFESMECRVESLIRNEVLLEYEVGFTFPKRPYQEELKARILNLIDHQEDQVRQLEEDMRKTKDMFMYLADSLIATLKVKIEAQRVHSTKIEKITRFLTHTPIVTPETLKPIMMHKVSMISNIKPTIYRTPHQHLNSNLKMPILLSFEENKLEYEDEDEVEIKMMGTRMDKESLEHNLYENDITPIICHNFSPILNPPIKPKDSGSFRMKIRNVESIVDIPELFRKLKFICHWTNPFKDFEWSNVPGIKLSSFSKSDDSFTRFSPDIGVTSLPISCNLQALSNLHYLLSGFMDYFWSFPSGHTSNALSIPHKFSALTFSSLSASFELREFVMGDNESHNRNLQAIPTNGVVSCSILFN
ncbi:hypothetical protein Tco_1067667 [Tanacetum coccineum]|uniref:Uncharacterized protein n=1 Tax=Tanacetum coccineum TaxID=301880 RepID=A0ABQ5HFC4_9ASTR